MIDWPSFFMGVLATLCALATAYDLKYHTQSLVRGYH